MLQQHKRRFSIWTSLDDQSWNQMDYILCIQRWRISIQSAKTRPGDDSDDELFIANFGLKLKKVGKAMRPSRYDLNQIPHDYTVEVRHRSMWLDLIDRVPEKLWLKVCDIVQETVIKMIKMIQEKEMQKSKMAVQEGLTNISEKKRIKKQRRKGKIYPF